MLDYRLEFTRKHLKEFRSGEINFPSLAKYREENGRGSWLEAHHLFNMVDKLLWHRAATGVYSEGL